MRRLLLLTLLAAPARADDLKDFIEKRAQPLVKDKPYATVVVGVIAKGDEQVFSFGQWDGKAPDRNSVYEIGSVTKAFTGVLLADRVKAGVVRLDDPVQKHLPEGWKVPRRDDRDITLLNLATHTSGLPKQANGFLAVMFANPKNPYAKYDTATLRKGLATTKLQHAIGARHDYSNVGVGLLGHALAFASKAPSYEAVLTERVLKPLGMADTGVTLTESQKKRLIPGHDEQGERQENWDFASIEACGALRSTAGDLLKFVKANAEPGGPLREALEMSHECWRVVEPDQEECGLCWVRSVNKKGPPLIWHNGQTGGYHAFVGFVPGKGGVAVLCNVATMKVDDVGSAVLRHLAEGK
jgi:D-alanyl-D-alanine-carboxypeptidase/D-alanyl-D-alanine-endopeptidase